MRAALLLLLTAALGSSFQVPAQWTTDVYAPDAVVGQRHTVNVLVKTGSLPTPCDDVRILYGDNPKATMSPPAGNVVSTSRHLRFEAEVSSHPGTYGIYCRVPGERDHRRITTYTIRPAVGGGVVRPPVITSTTSTITGTVPPPSDAITRRDLNRMRNTLRGEIRAVGKNVQVLTERVGRIEQTVTAKADTAAVDQMRTDHAQLRGTVEQNTQTITSMAGIQQAQTRMDQELANIRNRMSGHESRMSMNEMDTALAMEGVSRLGHDVKRWKFCLGFIPCGRRPVLPAEQTRVLWERAQHARTRSTTSPEQTASQQPVFQQQEQPVFQQPQQQQQQFPQQQQHQQPQLQQRPQLQ